MNAPELVIVGGHHSHDRKSHQAIRNVVWFETRGERDAFLTRSVVDRATKRQTKANGRTLYAAETLTYID